MTSLNVKIVITDTSSTDHTVYAQQCNVSLSGSKAHTFKFTLEKSDSTLRGWLTRGCIAKFYVDTNAVPTTLKLRALIEKVYRSVPYPKAASAPTEVNMQLTVEGTELFYVDIMNIRVAETYTDTTVNDIVTDLLSKYLPAADYGSHDITGPAVTIPKIHFNYRTLKECLDILAEYADATYNCSAVGAVSWKETASIDSGYTYTDADVEATPELLDTLLPVKNVVLGAFGIGEKLDAYEDSAGATYVMCSSVHRGHQFVASGTIIRRIGVYVQRAGTPAMDLILYVAADNAGVPGTVLGGPYSIPKADVPTAGGWVYVDVTLAISAGTTYWVWINRTGTSDDPANCYYWAISSSWYHSYARAYMPFGGSWTNETGYPPFAYRIYTQGMLCLRATDSASVTANRERTYFMEDESVTSHDTAAAMVNAKLVSLKDPKQQITNLQCKNVSAIPNPNELVTLALVNLDVADSYVVNEIDFAFDSETETKTFSLIVGDDIMTFSDHLAEQKRSTGILQANGLVVDDAVYPVEDV